MVLVIRIKPFETRYDWPGMSFAVVCKYQKYTRYDWPGEIPVTEWLAGSQQEVIMVIIMFGKGGIKVWHKFNFYQIELMTGVAGTMERECKPRRRLLIPALQDEPRRDPAPDRGVLSGMLLIEGVFLEQKLGKPFRRCPWTLQESTSGWFTMRWF